MTTRENQHPCIAAHENRVLAAGRHNLRIKLCDPEQAAQLTVARRIMAHRRDALRDLAR